MLSAFVWAALGWLAPFLPFVASVHEFSNAVSEVVWRLAEGNFLAGGLIVVLSGTGRRCVSPYLVAFLGLVFSILTPSLGTA
jgi:hypothetical protein